MLLLLLRGPAFATPSADTAHEIVSTRNVDLDFLEIGTSNFDSMIQLAGDEARGLSVDAIPTYLEALPDRAGVKKINAGLVAAPAQPGARVDAFFVRPADISRYTLSPNLRGCNMVGRPHPEAVAVLTKARHPELLRNVSIPAMDFEGLVATERVRSIGMLKLDIEGSEPHVLRSLVEVARRHERLWPRVIVLEFNKFTRAVARELERMLEDHRYILLRGSSHASHDRIYVRL